MSSHLSAKFICNLLKITEGMHVGGKVSVLLQIKVIKFKVHLGICLLMFCSVTLFVPLTFDELGLWDSHVLRDKNIKSNKAHRLPSRITPTWWDRQVKGEFYKNVWTSVNGSGNPPNLAGVRERKLQGECPWSTFWGTKGVIWLKENGHSRKDGICKGMGLATTDLINDPEYVGSRDEGWILRVERR